MTNTRILFLIVSSIVTLYFAVQIGNQKKQPTKKLIVVSVLVGTTTLYMLFPIIIGEINWFVALISSLFLAWLMTLRVMDLRKYFGSKDEVRDDSDSNM